MKVVAYENSIELIPESELENDTIERWNRGEAQIIGSSSLTSRVTWSDSRVWVRTILIGFQPLSPLPKGDKS